MTGSGASPTLCQEERPKMGTSHSRCLGVSLLGDTEKRRGISLAPGLADRPRRGHAS